MIHDQTIVAQVTCPGKSAVGILRISGNQASTIAINILGKIPNPRFATYSKFFDQNKQLLDEGICLWFPAPHSFTGEDILELQGHGNPLILDLLMKTILSHDDVRIAQPGEFCQRAFLNGKIDLLQAEAINDLINSETKAVVHASINSLQGYFSSHIKKLIDKIINFRTSIESSIDFSEEEIYLNIDDVVSTQLKELNNHFLEIKKIVSEGIVIRERKKIAIVGLPNAGKSSLLNILTCHNRAIVTNIPGTTRDAIYEDICINGIIYQIIDTAGLRDTDDKVEKIGIKKSWDVIKSSDHILFVIDKSIDMNNRKNIAIEFMKNISSNIEVTFILNKNDLIEKKYKTYGIENCGNLVFISISTLTGEGVELLKQFFTKKETNKNHIGNFIARRRHIHQIKLAFSEFLKTKSNWLKYKNIELLAESLKIINKLLGEINGEFTSSDLLNRIFSTFCIGK